MGSDSTLTALGIAGIALSAVAVCLIAVFGVVEARRWVQAFSGVRRIGIGPRFEVTLRSDLQVIDDEGELRPFLLELMGDGRRDEAVRVHRAFTGDDAAEAEAAVEALAREQP